MFMCFFRVLGRDGECAISDAMLLEQVVTEDISSFYAIYFFNLDLPVFC